MPKREAGCGAPKDEKKPGHEWDSLAGRRQEAPGRAKACGKRCVNACVEERKSLAATAGGREDCDSDCLGLLLPVVAAAIIIPVDCGWAEMAAR